MLTCIRCVCFFDREMKSAAGNRSTGAQTHQIAKRTFAFDRRIDAQIETRSVVPQNSSQTKRSDQFAGRRCRLDRSASRRAGTVFNVRADRDHFDIELFAHHNSGGNTGNESKDRVAAFARLDSSRFFAFVFICLWPNARSFVVKGKNRLRMKMSESNPPKTSYGRKLLKATSVDLKSSSGRLRAGELSMTGITQSIRDAARLIHFRQSSLPETDLNSSTGAAVSSSSPSSYSSSTFGSAFLLTRRSPVKSANAKMGADLETTTISLETTVKAPSPSPSGVSVDIEPTKCTLVDSLQSKPTKKSKSKSPNETVVTHAPVWTAKNVGTRWRKLLIKRHKRSGTLITPVTSGADGSAAGPSSLSSSVPSSALVVTSAASYAYRRASLRRSSRRNRLAVSSNPTISAICPASRRSSLCTCDQQVTCERLSLNESLPAEPKSELLANLPTLIVTNESDETWHVLPGLVIEK